MKVCALGRWHPVASLADASRFVLGTTESRGMGSTEWYDRGGGRAGLVVDAKGHPIARVSYNGRIWAVGAKGEELKDEAGRTVYRELEPSKYSRSNPAKARKAKIQYREFNPHLGSWGAWRNYRSYSSQARARAALRKLRSASGLGPSDLQMRVVT